MICPLACGQRQGKCNTLRSQVLNGNQTLPESGELVHVAWHLQDYRQRYPRFRACADPGFLQVPEIGIGRGEPFHNEFGLLVVGETRSSRMIVLVQSLFDLRLREVFVEIERTRDRLRVDIHTEYYYITLILDQVTRDLDFHTKPPTDLGGSARRACDYELKLSSPPRWPDKEVTELVDFFLRKGMGDR